MGLTGIQLTLYLGITISAGHTQTLETIVNGQTAWPGQFPYQVSLQQRDSHFCGGSIIDATHILTAAHCVVDEFLQVFRPDMVQVVTGVIDHLDARPGNTFAVSAITAHESYNPRAMTNDIAILKLSRHIPFNFLQKPIRLPHADAPSGAQATASGWGATWTNFAGEPGPCPRYLQQLQMVALGLNECQRFNEGRVSHSQLCAIRKAGTGICFGDSGGPLTYNGEIIGISSFVKGGCASPNADFFTRVYHHLPWIHKVLGSN